jgi:hypothetical protein
LKAGGVSKRTAAYSDFEERRAGKLVLRRSGGVTNSALKRTKFARQTLATRRPCSEEVYYGKWRMLDERRRFGGWYFRAGAVRQCID